jgi:tRNA G18 (ribose-2'-O)-methylase SpoU
VPAGVELDENAEDLETFEHPRRCVYLLGAEDNGLTKKLLKMPLSRKIQI